MEPSLSQAPAFYMAISVLHHDLTKADTSMYPLALWNSGACTIAAEVGKPESSHMAKHLLNNEHCDWKPTCPFSEGKSWLMSQSENNTE